MTRLPEPAQCVAISLAALAGFTDVVAFMALGGFFASFMSGNSTRLAIGAAGDMSDAWLALQLLVCFLAGVVGASWLGRRLTHQREAAILGSVAVLLLLCAGTAIPHQSGPLLLLAAAMGAANTMFERDGEVAVALTYMTGTIVRLGQALAGWINGDHGPERALPFVLMWCGFLGGGLAGAGLYARFELGALWLPCAASAGLAAWLWRQPQILRGAPSALVAEDTDDTDIAPASE